MWKDKRWAVVVLVIGCLLAACSSTKVTTVDERTRPARVDTVDGVTRVTLTQKAAERLGIRTAPVAEAEVVREGSSGTRVIPYAAVMYETVGDAFVYTNPEAFTYVRSPISVDYIEGDLAVLLDGPPAGTAVVTVGASELFGVEYEVGH